jgi:hypothetical protein
VRPPAAIAAQLALDAATVHQHISAAMAKLGVHIPTQLAVIAYQTGQVTTHTDPDAAAVADDARGSRGRRTRARILDAAAQALSANPDAALDAIAKQAQVSPATLYWHFQTREGLLNALADRG